MSDNPNVKKVEEILWKHEKEMSDGFDYYQGSGEGDAIPAIKKIAEEIVKELERKTE